MTNEAKPGEVAAGIARVHVRGHSVACHAMRTARRKAHDGGWRDACKCGYPARVEAFALAIDSAIADAVRKEAEECAKVAESSHPEKGDCCFEDHSGHLGRVNQCDAIADAIRARHTTDSKEQQR